MQAQHFFSNDVLILCLAPACAFPLYMLSQHLLNHISGTMLHAGEILRFALAAGPRYGTIPASAPSRTSP